MFSLAISGVSKEAAEGLNVDFAFYADDGYVTSPVAADLDCFMGRFVALMGGRGLEVQLAKCAILSASDEPLVFPGMSLLSGVPLVQE